MDTRQQYRLADHQYRLHRRCAALLDLTADAVIEATRQACAAPIYQVAPHIVDAVLHIPRPLISGASNLMTDTNTTLARIDDAALEQDARRRIQTVSVALGSHKITEMRKADDQISALLDTGWRIIDVSMTGGPDYELRHVTLTRDSGNDTLAALEKRLMKLEGRARRDDDCEDWKTGQRD